VSFLPEPKAPDDASHCHTGSNSWAANEIDPAFRAVSCRYWHDRSQRATLYSTIAPVSVADGHKRVASLCRLCIAFGWGSCQTPLIVMPKCQISDECGICYISQHQLRHGLTYCATNRHPALRDVLPRPLGCIQVDLALGSGASPRAELAKKRQQKQVDADLFAAAMNRLCARHILREGTDRRRLGPFTSTYVQPPNIRHRGRCRSVEPVRLRPGHPRTDTARGGSGSQKSAARPEGHR
jgi:hypothetical protein